ncbi:MAG: hypothetical protein K0Q72_3667, partial [Armatimonadetes bacterium]|nr:hypothetical protein [Armatimonadota bacterium]
VGFPRYVEWYKDLNWYDDVIRKGSLVSSLV